MMNEIEIAGLVEQMKKINVGDNILFDCKEGVFNIKKIGGVVQDE